MTHDLYEIIHSRRDVRGEFTGAPVPEATLDRILATAHAAPSVGLSQPWDFVVVRDRGLREAFHAHVRHERDVFAATLDAEAAARFARIKIDGVRESSLSIVVTYDPERGGPAVLGRHAIADAGLYSVCLAIENLWLAATAGGDAPASSPSVYGRSPYEKASDQGGPVLRGSILRMAHGHMRHIPCTRGRTTELS